MRYGAPGRAAAVLVSVAVMIQATPLHAADSQRYANAVTPLLDTAGGKTIGSLQPGAAVEVIDQSGSATHVALHGWSAQGANSVVFAAPDRHIVLLNGFVGYSQAGASQTLGGRIYRAVTVDGWTASAALTDDLQIVWKSAADLYAQKCGSCHALPVANSMTADQWPAIMKTQAPNAGLDANETALLTVYLQVNSVR